MSKQEGFREWAIRIMGEHLYVERALKDRIVEAERVLGQVNDQLAAKSKELTSAKVKQTMAEDEVKELQTKLTLVANRTLEQDKEFYRNCHLAWAALGHTSELVKVFAYNSLIDYREEFSDE